MRLRLARSQTSTSRSSVNRRFLRRRDRNGRHWPARVFVLLLAALLLAAPAAEARQRGGPPALTPQIVGGAAARPGDFPFMVSLQIRYRGQWRHNCGGTLLDATHVLTAAHCVTTSSGGVVAPSVYRAVVGRDRLGSRQGRAIPVAAIVRDPAFDKETLLNDAAVMTLARPWAAADDSPGWGSVLLPAAGDAGRDQPGQNVIAAGWGSTVQQDGVLDLPRHLANRLQWVALLIDDGDACAAKYDGTGWAVVDPALNLCASYPNKDACQGDSGGPLLVRSAVAGRVSYEQVGIVSSGRGCAWPGWPGVYTRLSAPAIRQFVACAVETGAACP